MMTLSVHTQLIDKNIYRTYWKKTVTELGGIVEIEVNTQGVDKLVIAELEALRYLLSEKDVFSQKFNDGKGIILALSQKLIPTLLTEEGEKHKEGQYSQILHTRMADAQYEVAEEFSDWIITEPDTDIILDKVEINSPKYDLIETPQMGTIVITRTSLEKFKKAAQSEQDIVPARPWKSLTKRITGKFLRPDNIPKQLAKMRLQRWGREAVIYGSNTDVFHYVTIEAARKQEGKIYSVLTTVYIKRRWKKEFDTKADKPEIPYLCSSREKTD